MTDCTSSIPTRPAQNAEDAPMPSKLLAPFTNPWQTLSLPMLSGDALFQSEPVTDAMPPLGQRLLPGMSVPAPPLDAAPDTWTTPLAPLHPADGVDAWVAAEMAKLPWWTVDELEEQINRERGPFIPLLTFLADGPEPEPEPSKRRVEKVHVDREEPADPAPADPPAKPPVKRRPSPRPRKTAPKADVA